MTMPENVKTSPDYPIPETQKAWVLGDPGEPNHVHLVWAVRRLTPIQAKYIGMFYGEETLGFLQSGREVTF